MSQLASYEHDLIEKVRATDLYKTYQNAFRQATGLPLRLVLFDEEWCINQQLDNQSGFCELLNLCESACQACRDVNDRLTKLATSSGPTSCTCYAGLTATAVPIRMGATTLGFLKTGQVFHKTPTEQDFDTLLSQLSLSGHGKKETETLRKAYLQTRTIKPDRYKSMVSLLDLFANQLSQIAQELATITDGSEPPSIIKARKYIHHHLDKPLPLPEVARHAGLSDSHFCRLFKETTGLTLTDYITRCRIDWAKRELLKPAARISDIAFMVGFQSLSQFNRAFAKLTEQSPSKYRKAKLNTFTH